jgi:biotin carboxyl carrier protein
MRYVALIGDRKHLLDVDQNGHAREVAIDGRSLAIDWQRVGAALSPSTVGNGDHADHFSLLAGPHSYEVYVRMLETAGDAEGGERTVEVLIDGRPYVVTVQDERSQALSQLAGGAHASGDATIRAPMPGLVANILAEEGAQVQRGQTIVVLEAMKMENDLTAARGGVVKSVRVSKGQTVNQGDILAVVGDPVGTPPTDEDEE